MARVARPGPQSAGTRRFGYGAAVVINAVMLFLINAWPGWQSVPILTPDTEQVLGLVNTTIIVGLVTNLGYLVYDALWFKALGYLITTLIGLLAAIRIWRVFPFDFGNTTFNWGLVIRIVLIITIVGSAIAVVVHLVTFARGLADRRR